MLERRRTQALRAPAVFVCLAAGLLAGCASTPAEDRTETAAPAATQEKPPQGEVPRPAAALSFRTPDGQEIELAAYQGKVVAVEFMSTTCPYCQQAATLLEKMYEQYGSQGFQPLGVAVNGLGPESVMEFQEKFGVKFPVGGLGVSTYYSFLKIPTSITPWVPKLVFIDRKGVIQGQYGGPGDHFLDNEEPNMRAVIEALLRGETPPAI